MSDLLVAFGIALLVDVDGINPKCFKDHAVLKKCGLDEIRKVLAELKLLPVEHDCPFDTFRTPYVQKASVH
jgi:hypothetical protein